MSAVCRPILLLLPVVIAGCTFSHAMYYAGIDAGCMNGAPDEILTVGEGSGLNWLRSADPRDRDLNSAWCETVGPAVFKPVPSDRFQEPSRPDTIAVLTWNVNVGGGDLTSFLVSELGLSCGELHGSGRIAPFVLLLQEAHRRSDELPVVGEGSSVPWTIDPDRLHQDTSDIVELADRCGLSLLYVPSARNGPDTGSRPREDKGNAILATLPLSTPAAIDLPFEAGRRVGVSADVTVPGGAKIRVVSLHLDVGAPLHRMLFSGNQTRARQASGFIEAMDMLESGAPAVSGTFVGADLNTWARNETATRLMMRAFPESPEWDELGTRGALPTDHMFYRSQATGPDVSGYRIIENTYYSDHRGRVLLLHF